MEGAVMWRNGARTLPRVIPCANSRERERETSSPVSQPVLVELRLQALGSRRRFDRCRGGARCGHAGRRAHREAGMAGQDQQECEAHTSAECPRETDPPTHQHELNRISRSEIMN
jgi:hypothetical protein